MINIIKCNDIEEYKVSILNYLSANTYPLVSGEILDKFLSTLEIQGIDFKIEDFKINYTSLNDFNTLYNISNSYVENNEKVILTFGDDENYMLVAYHHAYLTKSKLYVLKNKYEVIDFIRINTFKFITIIAEHSSITIDLISSISKIQEEKLKHNEIFYPGFLTARDIYGLISLITRNDIYKKYILLEALTINRLDYNNKEVIKHNEIQIFPNGKSNIDFVMESLTTTKLNLLTMIGHGRDDIFWLNNGAICGRSCFHNHELDKNEKGKPSCFYTGKCFKEDVQTLNAFDIASRNIFMNSCYSSKVEEGLFNDNYNLVFAFLDGHSVSYLGTSFMVDGQECMNYYYVAQIMSTIPIGIAATNISKFYLDYKLGHEQAFFLIGDPTNKVESNNKPLLFDINKNSNQEYSQIYKIYYDTYLISIRFKENDICDKFHSYRYKLEVKSTMNKELFLIFRKQGDFTYLDVFSKTIIKSGELEVIFKKNINLELSAIRNFEYILGVGIYPNSKFKSIFIETKDTALKLAKTNKYQMCNSKTLKSLYIKMDKFTDRVLTLSQTVLKFLLDQAHNKGYTWDDQCLSNGLTYIGVEKNCYDICVNCNRELYLINYQHEFYPELHRKYYCCSTCGIVRDFPYYSTDIDILVNGESTVCIGGSIDQTLIITNNSDKCLCGFGGMSISSGKDIDVTYQDNYNMEKIILQSGETCSIKTRIYFPEKSIPHNYWLYANIIMNGEVWVVKKDIWVSPNIKHLK